jgi:hypothetical protein
MLYALQGWDTSVRGTISKGCFVQGGQHPRIFGQGHIGRGHINPASLKLFCSCSRICHDDMSPTKVSLTVFPWTMRPLGDVSLGQSVPEPHTGARGGGCSIRYSGKSLGFSGCPWGLRPRQFYPNITSAPGEDRSYGDR